MATTLPALPPGFELVQEGTPATAPTAAGTGGLPPMPEGFVSADNINTPPKPEESVVPRAIDQMKVHMAGTLALPNLAVDAIQGALDVMAKPGEAGAALRRKVMGEPAATPEEAKRQWFLGNAPDKENVGGYKQASKAWEAILRADRLVSGRQGGDLTKEEPMPTDNFGKTSKGNEYISKIAGFVGSSIIPGAGPIVAAQRKFLTALVELGSNAASGISAVEGKEWGGMLAPKFGMTKQQGEQAGEQLFSLAGPGIVMAAGQALAKGSKMAIDVAEKGNIQNPFDKSAQKERANVILNQEILDGVNRNPKSTENLAELIQLQKKMEDFKPGIAQASNSPELVAMQKQITAQNPEALQAAVNMDARNAEAIAKYKQTAFPESGLPVNKGAQAKFATDDAILRQDIDNTDRRLQTLSQQYDRSVDKTAIGDELRSIYWTQREKAKTGLDRQIEDVYATANQVGLKADMTDVRDSVRRIMADDREAFQNAPGTWKKILAEFGGAERSAAPVQSRGSTVGIRREGINPPVSVERSGTEASFEKLHSLYREANREWADAVMAQKPDVARKLSIVKDMLETKVNRFQGPEFGMVGEKFGQFNQDYAAYARTFKEGAGGKLSARNKQGFGTDAEDIVDKVFLRAGDKAKGMDDFFRLYGNNERAAELLRDGLVDNYSRAAVSATGEFSAAGARRWMKQHETALAQMPNLRAELQGTTDTAGALVNRRRELVAQRQILDKSVMASAAREQRPEMLIEAGMKDPRMFKALLSSAKTQEAQQSLARGIVDMAVDKADPFTFLKNNEQVLKPVMDKLGKDHWSNLQTIAKAEEIAGRVKAGGHVELGKPQDIASKAIGTSVPSLLAKIQNVQAGRTNDLYQGVDVLSRYIYKTRSEELGRLRQAALFDPDLAGVMAKVVQSGKASRQDLLDLKAIAFANGISIGSQALQTEIRGQRMPAEERQRINDQEKRGVGLWK